MKNDHSLINTVRALVPQGIQFECQSECSACCTLEGGYVYLNDEESASIASYLQVDKQDFLSSLTHEIDGKTALLDGENGACVFLEDGRCLIYPVRPLQCRTFPFWPENLKDAASWQATKALCPGLGKGRQYPLQEILKILDSQL